MKKIFETKQQYAKLRKFATAKSIDSIYNYAYN